jgi:hypothetical protein
MSRYSVKYIVTEARRLILRTLKGGNSHLQSISTISFHYSSVFIITLLQSAIILQWLSLFSVVVFAETVPLIIPPQTEREELLREDKVRETGSELKGVRYGMRKKGEGGGGR